MAQFGSTSSEAADASQKSSTSPSFASSVQASSSNENDVSNTTDGINAAPAPVDKATTVSSTLQLDFTAAVATVAVICLLSLLIIIGVYAVHFYAKRADKKAREEYERMRKKSYGIADPTSTGQCSSTKHAQESGAKPCESWRLMTDASESETLSPASAPPKGSVPGSSMGRKFQPTPSKVSNLRRTPVRSTKSSILPGSRPVRKFTLSSGLGNGRLEKVTSKKKRDLLI